MEHIRDFKNVSYVIKRDDQVVLRIHSLKWYEIALKDPLEIAKVNPKEEFDDLEHLLRTTLERAIEELQDVLALDSFSLDAWCYTLYSDGDDAFRWHHYKGYVEVNSWTILINRFCPGHCMNCLQIIWVEPTWVNPSTDLSWTL